jgi:hypothetical protein
MLFRQRVKTVAHVVELPNFVQNCSSRHCVPRFPESLRPKARRWLPLIQEI